jgi:hypothetical protein
VAGISMPEWKVSEKPGKFNLLRIIEKEVNYAEYLN